MDRTVLAWLLLAAALGESAARGQEPIPVGPQFVVNSNTPTENAWYPSVAVVSGGGFVVVWKGVDEAGQPAVEARRYGGAGDALGPEFRVDDHTAAQGWFPSVAAEAGGGFVVAWTSEGSPGTDDSYGSIQARRFDASGSPRGPQFQVNTYTTNHQDWHAVAAFPAGGFAVVWESHGWTAGNPGEWHLLGQRFDATGAPVGSEFKVNTDPPFPFDFPSVAADAAGEFVVVWSGEGSGPDSDLGIQGQRFDASGVPAGAQFQVNTSTAGEQTNPSVGKAADGRFAVAWEGDSYDVIRAQRFDAAGAPDGAEIEVGEPNFFEHRDPSIAVEPDGDFLVVWQPGFPFEIRGRRYDALGQLLGTELRLNEFTPESLTAGPAAALEADGDFVVVFKGQGETGSYGIQGRRFSVTWIFLDGFESGDAASWTLSVP